MKPPRAIGDGGLLRCASQWPYPLGGSPSTAKASLLLNCNVRMAGRLSPSRRRVRCPTLQAPSWYFSLGRPSTGGTAGFLSGGVGCLALSVVFIGQARASWQIYPAYLLMAMGWSALNVVAITTLIALWFNTKRGLAISLALNGARFGGVAWAPILLAAIGHVGLGIASLAGAAVMLVVLVLMILAWGNRPPPPKPLPQAVDSVSRAANDDGSGCRGRGCGHYTVWRSGRCPAPSRWRCSRKWACLSILSPSWNQQ